MFAQMWQLYWMKSPIERCDRTELKLIAAAILSIVLDVIEHCSMFKL